MRKSRSDSSQRARRLQELGRIVAMGGGRFAGIQPGTKRIPDTVLFLDPKTGTTLAVPLLGINREAVALEIRKSRLEFAKVASKDEDPQ